MLALALPIKWSDILKRGFNVQFYALYELMLIYGLFSFAHSAYFFMKICRMCIGDDVNTNVGYFYRNCKICKGLLN